MAVRNTDTAIDCRAGLLSEPEYISQNRRAYDALSEKYDQRAAYKTSFEMAPSVLARVMVRHITTQEVPATIIEIGPGSGEALAYLETANYRTVAVELSPRIA